MKLKAVRESADRKTVFPQHVNTPDFLTNGVIP